VTDGLIRNIKVLLVVAGLVAAAVPSLAQQAAPPMPERNPMRAGEAAPDDTAAAVPDPAPDLPGDKPTIPWQDPKVAAARAACDEMLAEITLDYDQLDPIKKGICGTPAPILVRSIGSDPAVAITPPATMNCKLAVAIHAWLKDTVQPAATVLGSRVVKLQNASSYKCRNRYGGANTRISEHALANALDISEFVFASGQRFKVLGNWHYGANAGVPLAPEPPLPNPQRVEEALAAEDMRASADTTGAIVPVSNRRSYGSALAAVTKVSANPFVRLAPPSVAEPPRSPLPRKQTASRSERPQSLAAQIRSNPFVSPLPPPDAVAGAPAPQDEREDDTMADAPNERRTLQASDAALFMRAVHDEACKTFETVLGPEANAAHKDHFHFDMKKRRYVKICE
jgi:hypothetical protein